MLALDLSLQTMDVPGIGEVVSGVFYNRTMV
jgi:hypothetical protein